MLAARGATVVAGARGDATPSRWSTRSRPPAAAPRPRPLDVTDAEALRVGDRRRRRAPRPARRPGQQRRHHPRSAHAAHEAGRLGRGARHQPDRGLHAVPGGPQADDQAARAAASSPSARWSGRSGNAGQANYAASKAGLIGFCKSLAREVGLAQRHGQRRRARVHRDRHDARPHRGRAGSTGRRRFRSDGWARRPTSRRRCASSPRMRRRILLGRFSQSTAGCTRRRARWPLRTR